MNLRLDPIRPEDVIEEALLQRPRVRNTNTWYLYLRDSCFVGIKWIILSRLRVYTRTKHTYKICISFISVSSVDREIFPSPFFHESIIFFFFIDVNHLKDTTIISRRPNSKRLSSFEPSVSKIQSTGFYCRRSVYLLFESTFLFCY